MFDFIVHLRSALMAQKVFQHVSEAERRLMKRLHESGDAGQPLPRGKIMNISIGLRDRGVPMAPGPRS